MDVLEDNLHVGDILTGGLSLPIHLVTCIIYYLYVICVNANEGFCYIVVMM